MLASLTSALTDLLALLPFMSPDRAQIVIDSFWPMLKGGIYYSIPLALISFAIGMDCAGRGADSYRATYRLAA